ncbi:MAG: PQQ-binding-like beta-propeller repeat protein, partial [Bacteroidetes bacterium]|nr:PQQ-binding-like beta-propeller repeat protein [Bacteroidota bacterium]
QEKLNNLTIFYNIQDNGNQWIYQYWFFYVFNDYQKGVKNNHYGDWEAVYVFVDKNSGEVIKAIGTAHQRKIFDTEIYSPETNHIWSYIGNGSHANCVDKIDDGYCDSLKWRTIEKWDKNGYKATHNSYNLVEITSDYISKFNKAKTLENSSVLGINIFDFLIIENKEFYLPLGGNPPIYAWEQSSYYNSNEIVPISVKYITEYISNKANRAKNAIISFFKKPEIENQQAGIINSLKKEEDNKKEEKIEIEIKENNYIENTVLEPLKPRHGLESDNLPEPKTEIKKEVVKKVEEVQESPFVVSSTPPLGLPFFIGGGVSTPTPTLTPISTSTPTSTPQVPDTIPPSNIINLTANMGNSRGTIDLSWTAPGDDGSSGTSTEYIIKYATSSAITSLNWASLTDIINEPIPSLASSTESFSVNGLDVNQIYYWAIKSKDEVGNISDISNCVSVSPQAKADNLVISEIQIKGNLASDEFIELYNPTDQNIDLSNWSIQYRGSESASFNKKNFVNGNIIPANGYFLIVNNSYDGHMVADISHNSFQMSATGGSIFLVNNQIELTDVNDNSVIDKLSYGSGTYLFSETEEFTLAPGENQSLERKNQNISTAESLAVNGDEHWQGNNWDSNNNNQDFVLQINPNPQNSLSLTEPRSSFASLADTSWPMFQGNVRHTGVSLHNNNATGTPTSTPKWITTLSTPGPIVPVIGLDGSVYIGTGSGKLYKVTATGTSSIFYDVGINGTIEAPALASDGTVYMTDNKYLYALTADGQVIWKYSVYNTSAPVIALDGTIYIASDSYLYALTPNGEQIWRSPMLSNSRWIMSPVLDSSGNIYTVGKSGPCSSCQIVYALNPLDGSIIWQTNPGSYYTSLSLDDQGTLYVGSFTASSGLYALNSSDGSQKWHSPVGDILESIPSINQDIVYVGTYDNGTVYAINKDDGSVNWTYYIGGNISASPIIDNNGVIYIGSDNKKFYALNSDGSLKWLAELSDSISHEAVIDSNGTIYIASDDGLLYT